MILVGTSNALLLIENRKNIRVLRKGCFYGVTYDEEYIYAIERGRGFINIFDKKLQFKEKKKVPANHAHQILYSPEFKKIIVTSTGTNELLLVDKNFKVQNLRYPSTRVDKNHINSIFVHNNHIYTYEHDLESTKKERGNGGVRKLDQNYKPEKAWKIGQQGHNVYIKDEYIYILDTFGQKFSRRKMCSSYPEKSIETLISIKEYGRFGCRGLSITNDQTVIGLSKWLSREKRGDRHEGYVVFYDNNYKKISDLHLNYGQVFEVRSLNKLDYAHNNISFMVEK